MFPKSRLPHAEEERNCLKALRLKAKDPSASGSASTSQKIKLNRISHSSQDPSGPFDTGCGKGVR